MLVGCLSFIKNIFQFGQTPNSAVFRYREVLGSLNFRIRKFSYSFPFRHAYANNGVILFDCQLCLLSSIFNKFNHFLTYSVLTHHTDFPDIQYSTRCSIRLPKGERVRGGTTTRDFRYRNAAEFGVCPN